MKDRKQAARLAQLSDLTGMVAEAAKAELRQLQAQADRVRAAIADLNEQRRAQRPAPDPAHNVGADLLWLKWVDRQQAELNRQLARIRVEMEQKRNAAQRATGRDQVVRKLLEREGRR